MNRCSYRVIYGDTDQMGVVYYANYLVFFERGRCEFMREHGFDYAAFERDGFFVPVVDAHVKYVQPARFDDLLTIETAIGATTRITFEFSYRITKQVAGVDVVVATGTTRHACMDRAGRPVRLPPALQALLASPPSAG
ncbi:MAG TPA: thioesterase family protein [Myxococcota bacterium]